MGKQYKQTTGELTSSGTPTEVGFTNNFEKITISVNGSQTEISPQNAVLLVSEEIPANIFMYITEDAVYVNVINGYSYTALDEYIYVHNTVYDSIINN